MPGAVFVCVVSVSVAVPDSSWFTNRLSRERTYALCGRRESTQPRFHVHSPAPTTKLGPSPPAVAVNMKRKLSSMNESFDSSSSSLM